MGDDAIEAKWALEAKRVQVNEPSRDGMAMNMKEPAGQMWRCHGEIANSPVFLMSPELVVMGVVLSLTVLIVNSHHKVSIYSWP